MATRRGPGDPVDPFASLPLGQTLSGDRERAREAARRALDASLGQTRVDQLTATLPARAAETLAALRETPAEAARSADLAAIQRDLAERAEQARQQSLQNAERNRAERAERAAREMAEARAQAEQAREDHARVRAQTRQDSALDEEVDATTLTAIEQRLQRKVEAVRHALNILSEDLADVRQMLAKKTPAPTGDEEAPFREGERHLDIGGDT